MDLEIETALRALRSRHINSTYAEDCADARSKILGLVPENAVVGTGDSATLKQIGIIEELKKRGNRVLDGFDLNVTYAHHISLVEEATVCDVFLSGTNAVTQDGRIVNVDGVGNRVAGIFWGHPTSIIVVGKNKIVTHLDEAFSRIRNVIAPNHIRIRTTEMGGRRSNTPCATTGKCHDCRTEDRACNVFAIIEGKPRRTEINVIIVNQDLGLGWDESWSQERITKILESYKKFAWIPSAKPAVDD